MDCNYKVIVPFGSDNFTAYAVVRHEKEAWVSWAKERYKYTEDELSEIYDTCQRAVSAYEASFIESEDVPEVVSQEVIVSQTNNTKKKSRGSKRNKKDAATGS